MDWPMASRKAVPEWQLFPPRVLKRGLAPTRYLWWIYELAEANGELSAFRGAVTCLRLSRKIPLTYNVDKSLP